MSIRQLTSVEDQCIKEIFDYYNQTGFECAAYLETRNGPLVEFKKGTVIGADPSQAIIERALAGERFIVHHNHPTQGSISATDWVGVMKLNFAEVFAHSSDGTVYWGQCKDIVLLTEILSKHSPSDLTCSATFKLSDELNKHGLFDEGPYIEQLSMHVMNLALQIKGAISYAVRWGNRQVTPSQGSQLLPVHVLAHRLHDHCHSAANELFHSL